MGNKEVLEEKKRERIGQINQNRFGTTLKIINYVSCHKVLIEFQDDFRYKTWITYGQFLNGEIKNPFDKSVFGAGYIGVGDCICKTNNVYCKEYIAWSEMLRRCYAPNADKKWPTYANCTVCDEWHNFQNFSQWYSEHWYETAENKLYVDKDILYKGNKIYSPKTCLLVPARINTLIVAHQGGRGEYPLGVSYNKARKKYEVQLTKNKNGNKLHVHGGMYDSAEEAFYAYKAQKEAYIKEVADEYKYIIPQKVYEALYRYKIEITD